MLRWATFSAILLAVSGAVAQAQPTVPPSPTPTFSSDGTAPLAQIVRRGELIYRYDQAAWHTSDAMLRDVPRDDLALIRGWVVLPAEDGLRVFYYGGDPGSHFLIYAADWTDSRQLANSHRPTRADDRALPAEASRLAALIDQVPVNGPQNCSNRRFNIVALPASATGTTDSVYLLTPQTDRAIPFGGHHRVDFVDGIETVRRRFSNSCLAVPPQGDLMVVSHLLDMTPTEIHVFAMLAARKPIAVATTDHRIWMIEVSGGVTRVRQAGNAAAPSR